MRALAPLLLAGFLLIAGCGDDDDEGPAATSTAPGAADAAAKQDARGLTGLLDVCFSSTNDYRECEDEREGVARVVEAGARSYTVVAESESGTEFEIEHQANGVVAKICSPGGSGGCPDGGHW